MMLKKRQFWRPSGFFVDSPYRNELSSKVIKLQETGVLNQLKDKWWKEKRGGSTCSVSLFSKLWKMG